MAARQGLTREIDCKVVYVGPAGSGKTTTIRALHDRLAPDTRGPVLSPTLPGGGTLFFDLLTIELGTLDGRRIRLQLLSAPGDPGRSEVRRTVLRGADGVIFVSDSTPGRMEANLAALRDLSLPAIHKHVRVLEDAAMVRRRKIGRTNFLALERGPLRRLQAWMDQFHPWWGTREESLENYAEYLSNDPTSSEDRS